MVKSNILRTKVHHSPVKPIAFIDDILVWCEHLGPQGEVKWRNSTRIDGIEGGLQAVMETLPEDSRVIPRFVMIPSRTWVMTDRPDKLAKALKQDSILDDKDDEFIAEIGADILE